MSLYDRIFLAEVGLKRLARTKKLRIVNTTDGGSRRTEPDLMATRGKLTPQAHWRTAQSGWSAHIATQPQPAGAGNKPPKKPGAPAAAGHPPEPSKEPKLAWRPTPGPHSKRGLQDALDAFLEAYGAATGKLTARPTKTPLEPPQAREGARVQGWLNNVNEKLVKRARRTDQATTPKQGPPGERKIVGDVPIKRWATASGSTGSAT